MCGCVPAPRCSRVSGRRLAAVIPSGFPRFRPRGHGAVRVRAAGSIRAAAAPPHGGGQTCGRSRAARVRACSPGLERAAAGGQGPDFPVAHRIEDAGKQLAGRRGLGNDWHAAARGTGSDHLGETASTMSQDSRPRTGNDGGTAVAIAPDGTWLATVSLDKSARICDPSLR